MVKSWHNGWCGDRFLKMIFPDFLELPSKYSSSISLSLSLSLSLSSFFFFLNIWRVVVSQGLKDIGMMCLFMEFICSVSSSWIEEDGASGRWVSKRGNFGKILLCGAVVKMKWPFPSVQEKNCGFLKIAFFVCSAV